MNDIEIDDVWLVRKDKPVFEFAEMLINFYQPARLNRLITVDMLLAERGENK